MNKIILDPIGVIRTPFKEVENIPIQSIFGKDNEAYCELEQKYAEGMKDLDAFSHAILIYHFHKCEEEKILARPYLENKDHGVFAIRSPYRPNKIGFSIVKIKKIMDNKLIFTDVDILDGTPLLDIKPYVKHFDQREHTSAGWVEKHFKEDQIPDNVILNQK